MWEALEGQSDCRASAGFAWALAGWQCVAEPAGGALCVIAVWRGQQLEAVWGLVRYRRDGMRMLVPLGAEASDYTEILARRDCKDIDTLIDLLARTVRRLGDCIRLQHVDPAGLAAEFCARFPVASTRDPISSCYAHLRGFPTFEAYNATRNSATRQQLRRHMRRLGREGDVDIGIVDDRVSRLELVDWLLTKKAEWLSRSHRENPWLTQPCFKDFLHALVDPVSGESPLMLVRLRVDQQTIAGALFSVDAHSLEYFIGAYDPAWHDFSPGGLLIDHCVVWAYQHGRDFDFRIGDEAYKRSWARQELVRSSHLIALTPLGLLAVLREGMRLTRLRLRGRYRRSAGFVIGGLVKPLLRRLPLTILPHSLRQALVR